MQETYQDVYNAVMIKLWYLVDVNHKCEGQKEEQEQGNGRVESLNTTDNFMNRSNIKNNDSNRK